jgi:hypothetical protein
VKNQNNLRKKAKEVALDSFITPKEELLDRVEEELEKYITPEFMEKIRIDLVKKQKETTSKNPENKPEKTKE